MCKNKVLKLANSQNSGPFEECLENFLSPFVGLVIGWSVWLKELNENTSIY